MNAHSEGSACPEWDPLAVGASEDEHSAYDDLRGRCPVAHSDLLGWSVLRHADVLDVLHDHDTYRNHVSQHLSVPNGMDPPEHTPYRRLIEPYFGPEPMAGFEPVCDMIATDLVASIPRGRPIEVMDTFGHEFAVRVQCAFMGWSHGLHEPLRAWVHEQHRATLADDRDALAASARRFDEVVHEVLAVRRKAGVDAPDDPTTQLLHEHVDSRPLTDAEIVSIVRNWTVGELATIAASVGIIVAYLANHPEIESRLPTRRRISCTAPGSTSAPAPRSHDSSCDRSCRRSSRGPNGSDQFATRHPCGRPTRPGTCDRVALEPVVGGSEEALREPESGDDLHGERWETDPLEPLLELADGRSPTLAERVGQDGRSEH